MEDQKNNQRSDPRDVITETYEDLDMAEIVNFDKYEEMIYDDLEERERSMIDEINDGYDEYEEYMMIDEINDGYDEYMLGLDEKD